MRQNYGKRHARSERIAAYMDCACVLTGRERQGVHSGGPERKIAYAQLHWPLKGKTVVIRSAL